MNKILKGIRNTLSRLQYNSPVILTYALVSLAIVLLNGPTQNRMLYSLFSVHKSSFTDPLTYIRVFGHALGHVNFDHYFSNIMIILMIGPVMEEKYGSRNTGIMMALTALITGIAYMLLFDSRLTGGSGIVFMLILLSSYANVKDGRIPLTLVVSLSIFLGREVAGGVTDTSNISHFSHVLGGLCGAAFGFLINKKRRRGGTKETLSKTTAHTPPADDDKIIDLTGKE